jgi:hypothetical protein
MSWFVIAMGLFLVVLPVVLDAFYRYRKRQAITCPETQARRKFSLMRCRVSPDSVPKGLTL